MKLEGLKKLVQQGESDTPQANGHLWSIFCKKFLQNAHCDACAAFSSIFCKTLTQI